MVKAKRKREKEERIKKEKAAKLEKETKKLISSIYLRFCIQIYIFEKKVSERILVKNKVYYSQL